jgi:hypothetical protein
MSSQRNHSDMFRFRRAAFYQNLKSKVGLAACKAAVALRTVRELLPCEIGVRPLATAPRALVQATEWARPGVLGIGLGISSNILY